MRLADKNAENTVKETYEYLKKVGDSDCMIFGHQNDYFDKAGSPDLTPSDTKDVTGEYAGVFGLDALSFYGYEYSAHRWNETHEEQIEETVRGNIRAAAQLCNYAIDQGSIITLSSHMPDFAIVKKDGATYDYGGYTPNVMEGDPANNILPGEKYNDSFRGYLDNVAEFASQVKGTVIFRPFHENTGSWFWWGEKFTTPERFKELYRYVFHYLTEEKNIHNLLFAYSPGSEPQSPQELGIRYPGDEFVDLVGFDMYDRTHDDVWLNDFRRQVELTDQFAREHDKLFAVTETGVANETQPEDSQTALLRSGNESDWYNKVLDAARCSSACYFLLWADFSRTNGYYIPYVDRIGDDGTLEGHELIPDFLAFYNSPYSIFTKNS